MTRKLLVLFFSILFLVFVTTVRAESLSTTGGALTTTASPASKLKGQIQLLEKQKKAAVMKVREDAKALIQTKREEFKTRIQTIKDQRKKTLAERIDTKLAEINQKHTAKFSEVLARLQGFLDKIKQRATDAKVLADITIVQTTIDTTVAAVDAQAAKAYTMEITDDTTLKLNAGTVVSQLKQDLTAVHKLVIDAKQAVQKLNTDRKLIKKEASSSANL